MQIASEAIRLTFKHWPPLEGLTRQPYCLAINLHLITHNASLVGGNLLGNTPLWWGLGTIWLLLFTRLSHVLVPEMRCLRGQVAASPACCSASSTVSLCHLDLAPSATSPQVPAGAGCPMALAGPSHWLLQCCGPQSRTVAVCFCPATQGVSESLCTLLISLPALTTLGRWY